MTAATTLGVLLIAARADDVVDSPHMLVSVVLDISVNDSYESDGHGPATTGVALFLDTKAKTLEKAIAAIK